jgi:hypothetical protein
MYYNRRGRLRARLVRFFSGRYGVDALYYVFFVSALVFSFLSLLFDRLWLNLLAIALLGYAFSAPPLAISQNANGKTAVFYLFSPT